MWLHFVSDGVHSISFFWEDSDVKTVGLALALMGFLGQQALAAPFSEGADAGYTMATATVVPGGTTTINGSITNTTVNDVDLYRIAVTTSGPFTIEAKANVPNMPDMNLLVFDSAGHMLAGDDDNDSGCTVITSLNGYDSCLTLNLTAGTYYIAVGTNNIGAFVSPADVPSGYFASNDSGILSLPSAEVVGLVASESSLGNDEGAYTINFSAATGGAAAVATAVPTLGEWALVILFGLLAVTGLVARRRLPT